jgi:hypothetical protein
MNIRASDIIRDLLNIREDVSKVDSNRSAFSPISKIECLIKSIHADEPSCYACVWRTDMTEEGCRKCEECTPEIPALSKYTLPKVG